MRGGWADAKKVHLLDLKSTFHRETITGSMNEAQEWKGWA